MDETARPVYVLRAEPSTPVDSAYDPAELWATMLRRKRSIALIAAAFFCAGLTYSFLARHWFQADVTLAPVQGESLAAAGLSQFAGLANIAGISLPKSGTAEAIATLRSRDFAAAFIADRALLPVLFASEWDTTSGSWRRPDKAPQMGDAVKFFRERVLAVREDKIEGLVTVSVRWTDPVLAADWANDMVQRVNGRLRESAVRDSERNIAFLRSQLVDNSVVALQQSVGRVLESELQKFMLAKGHEEFAFKVIDPATVPLEKYRPQRILIMLLSVIVGLVVGAVVVIIRDRAESERPGTRL
jgi:uncharacterized protein involved in exopolysaccharide biosynthesis